MSRIDRTIQLFAAGEPQARANPIVPYYVYYLLVFLPKGNLFLDDNNPQVNLSGLLLANHKSQQHFESKPHRALLCPLLGHLPTIVYTLSGIARTIQTFLGGELQVQTTFSEQTPLCLLGLLLL